MSPTCWRRACLVAPVVLSMAAPLVCAQVVTERGLVEATGIAYPQQSGGDSRLTSEGLFRQEASWRAAPVLTLAAAFDARAATDDRVERTWALDWSDRGLKRPALSVRRLSAVFRRGGFTFEAGKQFVRWGKTDVINPTDRFAPRDFMEVVDNEFLAVTAARATYERGGNTLDLVWQATFTPSRLPLAGTRWATALPAAPLPIVDAGGALPSRPQAGVRWNHVATGYEYSVSYYDGFNHLPRFELTTNPGAGRIDAARIYPTMRMAGADAAWSLPWFTVKGEAGYFWTADKATDDYGVYVVQVERQHGEWLFVGGYAGEFVTNRRSSAASPVFVFDRGLAGTFVGRASCTIDARSDVAFEGAIRRNADGGWLKGEYSRSFGQHWRAIVRADLLRGNPGDFFGQYRRNSSARLTARFSY